MTDVISGTAPYAPDEAGWVKHGSAESPIAVEEERATGSMPAPYINWEYEHIGRELAHYKRFSQHLLREGDLMLDRIVCRRANGEMHVFYFDVTKQLAASICELESVYKKMVAEGGRPPDPQQERQGTDGLTRFVVMWHPGFECGLSRAKTAEAMRASWRMVAGTAMVERRRIVFAETDDPRVHERCGEFLREVWNREMRPRKTLSVVLIGDPVWEQDELRWKSSLAAMKTGYEADGEKPQFAIFSLENVRGIW